MAEMDDFVERLLKTDGSIPVVDKSEALPHASGREATGPRGGAYREITLLKHAWMNEKQAPELLPFVGDELLGGLVAKVAAQEAKIKDITQALASSGTRGSGRESVANQHQHRTMLLVYQTEVDRIKYLIRSYLRTRLAKMERHGVHLVKLMAKRGARGGSEDGGGVRGGDGGVDGDGDGEGVDAPAEAAAAPPPQEAPATTEAENTYLHNYLNLVGRHMEESVLNFLPRDFNSMLREDRYAEEDDAEDTMTPVPDLSSHVIACPTEDLNQEDLLPCAVDEFAGDPDDVWKEGVPVMLQYSTVRDAVARGHLRLL